MPDKGLKIVVKRPTPQDRKLYEDLRVRFEQFRRDTILAAGVIHESNAETIAARVRNTEIGLAYELVRGLSRVRDEPIVRDFPLCQTGETCVPHSVANGLLGLSESSFFGRDRSDRKAAVNMFIDHFLATEPGHDRGERRSLDRVHHYFSTHSQRGLGLEESFRFELTGSLLDMVFALYSEDAFLLVVTRAHCLLAYGLSVSDGQAYVEVKDPLLAAAKGYELGLFAERFCWSALGGLPYAVSLGATYDPAGALKLIEDQRARGNLGVLCSSGILRRA